jgi:hypothetical protein
MKYDPERIRTDLQLPFGRNAPMTEHVVRLQNRLVVQINVCKRIQAGENQVYVVVRKCSCIDLKCRLIFPIRQSDPLQMEFVVSIEWVGNKFIV